MNIADRGAHTGCAVMGSGETFCPEHCPAPDACEVEHVAIFASSEFQCGTECDECFTRIDCTAGHFVDFEDKDDGGCSLCGEYPPVKSEG